MVCLWGSHHSGLVLCLPQTAPPGHHETAAGRLLSTMRRPQGFLSGRLSGVGAKEPLWLPIGDQGRLVSDPLWLPTGDQGRLVSESLWLPIGDQGRLVSAPPVAADW